MPTNGLRIFEANDVGVDRNEFGITVGLAHDASRDDSEDALLLQRSAVPGIDKPGIAGVYIEVPIQRYVAYGGILKATLSRDSFEVLLSDDASRLFGGNAGYRGHFRIDEAAFEEFRQALRFVFRDCNCYEEVERPNISPEHAREG